MIITTTPMIEGKKIVKYLGIVTGEADDPKYNLTEAIKEMEEKATSMGANAIVGVDLDYEVALDEENILYFILASGTAVVVENI